MTSSFRKAISGFVGAIVIMALLPIDSASAASYTLTVKKAGTGQGTVVSSPGGISCGSKCSATAPQDTVISLLAEPTGGSAFTGWSGACTGTGSCIVTMTGAVTVTATFAVVPRELTVTTVGSGSVTSRPSGISCGSSSTCTKNFNSGTTVTLTATPTSGNVFSGWSGACSNSSGSCVISMSSAKSVTATFSSRPALNVSKSGAGLGTVTSSPSGINCGRVCSTLFPRGTTVTLTATTTSGNRFVEWVSDSCSGSGTCSVTVDEAKTVIAVFQKAFPLTVAKAGIGTGTVTSSPTGINCGSTCSTSTLSGESVTLTATPTEGHIFTGWSGACTNSSGTCTVAMSAARTVTATFQRVPLTLTVAKTGIGSGTVISNIVGINCGTLCSASVLSGTTLSLTALPSAGSAFAGWSGPCDNTSGPCSVTMLEAETLTASFAAGFALTLTKSGGGSGSVTSDPEGVDCTSSCSYSFVSGTPVTLTATPAAESTFTGWSGGGCSGTGTCTVTMSAAKSVTANFAKVQYNLAVVKEGDGSGTVTSAPTGISCIATCMDGDDADFDSGTVVTLTASAPSGNVFTGWSGACSGSSSTCTVTMTGGKVVTATFEPTFLLTVAKDGDGTGTVTSDPSGINCGSTCSKAFRSGTSVTLTATPVAGQGVKFAGWSGGACSGTDPCSVTMSEAKNVTATFEKVYQTVEVSLVGDGTGFVTSNPAGIACGSDCDGSFVTESSVTLTATAVPGSAFTGWGGDCSGTAATCTVTLDSASSASDPKTVTATFEPYYELTVTKVGSGSVTSSPSGISCGSTCSVLFSGGSTVTLTAKAASGSIFTGWSGGVCSGTGACTVTMSAAKGVTATFVPVVTLTISKSGSTGSGTITSSPGGIACGSKCWERFATGATVTLTATPAAGSKFSGWNGGGCSGTSTTCVVTMNVTLNVNALFEPS